MKLHIDTERRTVTMEGSCKVSTVFNYLMSWFPEDWEQWEFIPFTPTIQYKEVIVQKEVVRNPYWNPWQPNIYHTFGVDTGTPITNPCYTTSQQSTINFNQI